MGLRAFKGGAFVHSVLRQASSADIAAMMQIRMAVRENRLVSMVITETDCLQAIEPPGRGWVIEVNGRMVGFAIGNSATGNIWALFVRPDFEKQGFGRRLHDVMVDWLWSMGLTRLWLTTAPTTRAQGFYEAAGWRRTCLTEQGEIHFELLKL